MNATWTTATIVVGIVFIIYPLLSWLLLRRPAKNAPDELRTKFWKKALWCLAFGLYGICAFPATIYLGTINLSTTEYWEIGMAAALYVLPLAYILPGIKTYNMTQNGLLFFLGKDECNLDRGFWFLPPMATETVLFNTTLRQYQFPDDSEPAERKPIQVNTAEHVLSETDKTDSTVKITTGKASEVGENQVLGRVLILDISPFVQFKLIDARTLYTNFSDIYDEEGEEGVAKEIARQLRDAIVAETTELFPTKTSKEIFDGMKDINAQIKARLADEAQRLGIDFVDARLATVKFSKEIEKILTDIAENNAASIKKRVDAKATADAYTTENDAKFKLAERMTEGAAGEKLEKILTLEAAVKIGEKGTNYNIGNLGDLGLQGILNKLTGSK
jgi:hypothetical protein